MVGSFNRLQDFNESTGFSLTKPYCELVVVYDGQNRVTSAVYWKDNAKTVPLESFTITYDASGVPTLDGVEYPGMKFDPWRGRMVFDDSGGGNIIVGNSGGILCQGTLNSPANNCPTYQFVSSVPNQSLYFPTSAETLSVVSTSSEDATGSTGIHSVLISGLSGAGASQSETLSLTGTTPAISVLSYLRVNTINSTSVGSNFGARGTITFINTTSLVLMEQININKNRIESCKISIPSGSMYQITGAQFTADRLSEYEVELRYWSNGGFHSTPGFTFIHVPSVSQNASYSMPFALQLTGLTDIACLCRKVSGRNGRSTFSGLIYGALSV